MIRPAGRHRSHPLVSTGRRPLLHRDDRLPPDVRHRRGGQRAFPLSIVPNRKGLHRRHPDAGVLLGRADAPARFDRFDYRQKFEYWGLVLGAVVVISTGSSSTSRSSSPASSGRARAGRQGGPQQRGADGVPGRDSLAHLQRALEPDVFPFDKTIFTGKISLERMEHEHPLELEAHQAGAGLDEA